MSTTAGTARAVGTVTLKPFRQRYWLPIVGSLVAAFAPNMGTLIASRALQGLGVGPDVFVGVWKCTPSIGPLSSYTLCFFLPFQTHFTALPLLMVTVGVVPFLPK